MGVGNYSERELFLRQHRTYIWCLRLAYTILMSPGRKKRKQNKTKT